MAADFLQILIDGVSLRIPAVAPNLCALAQQLHESRQPLRPEDLVHGVERDQPLCF